MTPDEQQMIQDFFQRLASQGRVDKDPQAARLINDQLRANPDATYSLVQTALVYEYQMEEQERRIRDLEDQIADLQRGSSAPAAGGGSFLGGRAGAGRAGGSVPGVSAQREAPSPWQNTQAAAPQQPSRTGWFGGGQSQPAAYSQPAPQPVPQAAPQGGGFFRSALQTAAGVAGGMMVANSLSGLFGGGSAQAAGSGHNASDQSALRDADATQDELQDAQLEADAQQDDEQDASYDSGSDGGGWDSEA